MDGRDLCDGTDVDRSGAEQAELLAGMMMMMMRVVLFSLQYSASHRERNTEP